jgi:cell wall-associated NlpC family hydrolase
LAGAIALAAASAGAGRPAPSPTSASTPSTPAIKAKQAQARQILEEIATIDEGLNVISEEYDGARVQLKAIRKNLAAEQVLLAQARAKYLQAQQRAARLLVWMYTSSHANSLDVILGAHSLGEMLKLSDAENQLSKQATLIAAQTAEAKHVLELRVQRLAQDRKEEAATVRQLASHRREILHGLAVRRRLLASVQAQVRHLEAVERARQARLAAEARARLQAEIAAAKAAAAQHAREAAAARRAQLAAARAKTKSETQAPTTAGTTSTTAATTTTTTTAATTVASTPPPTTTTTTTAATTTATPPAGLTGPATTAGAPGAGTPAPTASGTPAPAISPALTAPPTVPSSALPAGHPQAAQIALAYLGVPYLWGGSTPAGFDCSGLVSYVFAQLGIALPHFAAAQWTYGVPVAVSQLQPGDLVFFDALDHVGIYLGDNLFIDAPHTGAFVRIDSLSEGWYARKYVGARRI